MEVDTSKHCAPRLLRVINKAEDWFLITMLSTMVVLAIAQIFYRNIFGEGVVWIDPLLRILVLWTAISGAVIATRTDNHIKIDFFTKYFSDWFCALMQRIVYAFCFFICGLISWHAVRFVRMDYEVGTIAFASVPAWVTELIIPAGFFLIAVRYLMLFISPPKPEKY
jgi:TRAP-type C4-dicarboxylate transport system permease small subunit